MENELRRYPDVETGGLLLGYSDADRGVFVAEAADGGYRNALREPCSFQYDEEYVAHVCAIVSALYTPPLDVVGIWHKHNCAGPVPFSQADEAMHAQLQDQSPFPCLSVLFEKTDDTGPDGARYDVRVFALGRPAHTDVSRQTRWLDAPGKENDRGRSE